MAETAYVYKWTHKPSLKWYIGSRTSKGCHPDDGYVCSSKIVKPLIEANPQDWERTIIQIGSAKEMRDLEKEILILFEAHKDPRSFNLTNTVVMVPSNGPWNKGKKGVQVSWNKGKTGEQHHRWGKKLDYKKPHTLTDKAVGAIDALKERNKLVSKIKHVCPHCQKAGEGHAMLRWHFANCRRKGGK